MSETVLLSCPLEYCYHGIRFFRRKNTKYLEVAENQIAIAGLPASQRWDAWGRKSASSAKGGRRGDASSARDLAKLR